MRGQAEQDKQDYKNKSCLPALGGLIPSKVFFLYV